jgi:pyridoxine/pyridoxamine 5'-phosphate oxidase
MVIARLIDGDGVDLRNAQLFGPTSFYAGSQATTRRCNRGFRSQNWLQQHGQWILLASDKVIVPRRNMAMRFATVDKNGKYSKRLVSDATSKVSAYITMTQVRAYIVGKK